MDSVRKKTTPRKFPPLPRQQSPSFESPFFIQKPDTQFSHSFTLSPHIPQKTHLKKEPKRFPKLKRIFLLFIAFFLSISVITLSLLLWRAHRVSQTTFTQQSGESLISETAHYFLGKSQDERKPLRGEEEGRINILLLGKAGKNYPGQNLTDTVIIASIDTQERKTALLSLPRDLYVHIPDTNTSTKLNAIYLYGQKEEDPFSIIRSVVEEVTGLPIHYSIAIDYDGFIHIIDALGGINITVERDFYDPAYPGPNYSYETFELKKGFHTLDGETALKYVRERHNDPQGDFGRSLRQQQVIQSIKNKAFTRETFLNFFTLYSLLEAIEKNIRTDFSPEEIKSALTLVQTIDTQNINTLVVDAWKKESLLRVSHITLENGRSMFVLVPRTGTYEEIRETASAIFTLKEHQVREEKIRQEDSRILLIDTTKNIEMVQNVRDLLIDLGFETITIIPPIDTQSLSKTYVRKISDNKKSFSLDEIMKKVPASLSEESLDSFIPKKIPEDTDFILLLGNDILSNYLWKKGTVEEYLQENSQ